MEISETNIKLIAEYFTGNTGVFDEKDEDYKNIMLSYASDNNSSTIRELVTLFILGYSYSLKKHGYDGIDMKTGTPKEVKPKYIAPDKKINNSGNFNDMTMELLESKKNYDIICSAYCYDKLLYIVEFPMSAIIEHLKKPILKAKAGKRVVCQFGYKQYDCDELKVHYLDSETIIKRNCLSKNHFKMLNRRYNENTITKFSEC